MKTRRIDRYEAELNPSRGWHATSQEITLHLSANLADSDSRRLRLTKWERYQWQMFQVQPFIGLTRPMLLRTWTASTKAYSATQFLLKSSRQCTSASLIWFKELSISQSIELAFSEKPLKSGSELWNNCTFYIDRSRLIQLQRLKPKRFNPVVENQARNQLWLKKEHPSWFRFSPCHHYWKYSRGVARC